jgi:hypothetical protein
MKKMMDLPDFLTGRLTFSLLVGAGGLVDFRGREVVNLKPGNSSSTSFAIG